MEQTIKSETEVNTECFIYLVIGEVVCHETDVARQLDEGKAFAEHNKTVFDVAMAVAKFYQEQLDLRMDAYARERQALDEIAKLKEHIKKVCAESSADINKLKYIEYCFYNSCDPTDFYELTEPPKAITLSEAIDFCKNEDTKDTKTQLRNEQFVTWFTKLASYEDCTYITHEWLKKNGFEKRNKYEYLYCNDAEEIIAMLKDEEAGIWHIYVNFLDHGDMQEIDICTLGQFRMFLAICGLDNLVNEFKS